MESWDTLYPFTAEEVSLFAQLHQKVTKFPAPSNLKSRAATSPIVSEGKIEYVDRETEELNVLELQLDRIKREFLKNQTILRDLDLLLEAHKQLNFALEEVEESPPKSEVPLSPTQLDQETLNLSAELSAVQSEITRFEQLNLAIEMVSTCSIPSLTASDPFLTSLRLLLETDAQHYSPLLTRSGYLMRKCWDNALIAMNRVLERDLVSLEDYLDDRAYKEMRDRVLKPLDTLEHFIASYSQLRVNSVTFILDDRLNTQFTDSREDEQILHLIERTRLLMVVESREFDSIFGNFATFPNFTVIECKKVHLNKILETIGNLLYQRIEPLCNQNSIQKTKISNFIHPLMNSILAAEQHDPFGLFLKLLSQKHFPISDKNNNNNKNVKIQIHSTQDTTDQVLDV